jgi:hypothetical protein
MTYRGQVRNGVVVLESNAQIAEGAEVEVHLKGDDIIPTIAERFANVIGKAKDLPEDFAENHDHYIHGATKKSI